MLLIALTMSISLMATDCIVSGAGTASVNGTYVEGEEYNGKPQYRLGTTSYYLRYNNSRWEIMLDEGDPYYYTNDSGDTPPSSGWIRDEGDNPVPTVLLQVPSIYYSTSTFYESNDNDGSIPTILTITCNNIDGLTFTDSDGDDFVSEGKIVVTNLPAGLTAAITRTNSLELSVSLTGNASSHGTDIINLTFTFQNTAFSNGNAGSVTNSTKSDLTIDFINAYTVASSGADFLSISLALSSEDVDDGDKILLAAETFTETDLTVTKNISIIGQGSSSTTVQAATSAGVATSSVFSIQATATVTLKDMTICYGKSSLYGGGINVDDNNSSANLIIESTIVQYNTAVYGGGINSSSGDLTIKNSIIRNNTATNRGGGINKAGKLSITNSTINNNDSGTTGGGGLYYNSSSTEGSQVTNSTFCNNNTTSNGGAMYLESSIEIQISNTTIAGNTASTLGGGIFTNWATIDISNTILANNEAPTSTNNDLYVYYGIHLNDIGFNIVGYQDGNTTTNWYFNKATDILYSHDWLGGDETTWNQSNLELDNQNLNVSSTLADNNTINGTQTLALSAGSFAIDAGIGTSNDQRGVPVFNNFKDIGAYEYSPIWVEWIGGTSTAWGTSTNWSSVPVSSSEIGINGNCTYYPSVGTSETCNSLNIASGASFTIEDEGSFTVSDDLTNNGILTINSDASNSGSLIVNGTSTGNITYNRYMTGSNADPLVWHLISSPVVGQFLNAAFLTNANNAIATNTGKYGLAPYNNATPGWDHYFTASSPSTTFTSGKGYEIARTEAGIVAFTGTVNTDNGGVSNSITAPSGGNAWNLVGNPYPSAICANIPARETNNLLSVNTGILQGSLNDSPYQAVYVWDANADTPAYITVNNSTAATYISPGQGFFVYSNSPSATFSFTEAMQTHQTGDIFKSSTITTPAIKLFAERSEGTSSTNIKYFENSTTGLDPGYDGGRFTAGDNSFAVFTNLVGDSGNKVDFDIQCLPAGEFDHIIPIGLNAPENTEVVFRVETMNLPANVPVYLEDKLTGTFTSLHEAGSFYTVKMEAQSQGTGRYFLHTKSAATGINMVASVTDFTIITRPQNNSIRIIGSFCNNAEIAVYNMAGYKLLNRTLNDTEMNDVDMGRLISGFYLVSVRSASQKRSKKISWVKNQ